MIRIYKNLSTKFLNMVNSSKKLKPIKAQFFIKEGSLLIKKNCQLCDETAQNKPFFCDDCYNDLPRSKIKCNTCSLPIALANSEKLKPRLICGECLALPPSFTETVCPLVYEFPVNKIIGQVKYSKRKHWAKALTWALQQEYLKSQNTLKIKKPDLLIPIPMHRTKHKERGFNQAELIAQLLSKATGIIVAKNSLLKTKPTDTQAQLNKKGRISNLSGSFCISKKTSKQGLLIGKHVALVDDVMTTKVTCELASKLLLEHGAKQVDVWCLARTPKLI